MIVEASKCVSGDSISTNLGHLHYRLEMLALQIERLENLIDEAVAEEDKAERFKLLQDSQITTMAACRELDEAVPYLNAAARISQREVVLVDKYTCPQCRKPLLQRPQMSNSEREPHRYSCASCNYDMTDWESC